MPYVAPSTVVAGQTYGASAHNVIVNDVIDHESRIVTATNQSVQVFTNEAARNAAIASPSEGMMCYLTAPTVPTATGGSTMLPTGILTVYNGGTWVCVTPVGAYTSNGGSTTSTSYTTTLSGSPGTNPSVTLTTGTTALLMLSMSIVTSSGIAGAIGSVAVSGATTLAASDNWMVVNGNTGSITSARTIILTGLTAGTNTFTIQYRNAGGGQTTSVAERTIVVNGIA